MAKRTRPVGLSAYFGHTTFDLKVETIQENQGQRYLEYRLAQVDMWLTYLDYRVRRNGGIKGIQEPQREELLMEVMYLQAVRAGLANALRYR